MDMKRLALAVLIVSVLSLGCTAVYSYNFTGINDAARSGNIKQLDSFLKGKPDLARATRALDEAVNYDQPKTAKLLLDYIKSTGVRPEFYANVLVISAGNGNREIAQMIFQSGLAPGEAGNYKPNPVEKALFNGKIDTAIYLVQKGVKPQALAVAISSDTKLQISEEKQLELVNALIKSNTDIDQKEWRYVLTYAVSTGNIALVDKILEKCQGTTINAGLIPGYTHNSPFDVRPRFDKKMLDYLFSKGADPKSPEAYGSLYSVLISPDIDMVKYFIDKGVPVNDTGRGNILTSAVQMANPEIVKLLIERGADVNRDYYISKGKRKSDGMSPLMGAIEKLDPEMVELLLKSGARTNTESTTKDALLSQLKNIRDNIEWFDFGHIKACERIEKMLNAAKN